MRATELIGKVAIRTSPCVFTHGGFDRSYMTSRVLILAATSTKIAYRDLSMILIEDIHYMNEPWCDDNWSYAGDLSLKEIVKLKEIEIKLKEQQMGTDSMGNFRYMIDGLYLGSICTEITSSRISPKPMMTFDPDIIEDVIYNDPATIVKWCDGTKTIVQVQDGDEYDRELGLSMAICKKMFGNKGNYNEIFKKWVY